jgi:hypothetical protein
LLELGSKVANVRRAYLDKCFWIRLRDQAAGTRDDQSTAALLDVLRSEVRQGGLICPISETLFLELLSQADLGTRRATAELIDEFSTGVSLRPREERFDLEVETLLLNKLAVAVEPIEHRVWSRAAFVLGIQHPNPHPSLATDAVQIGFFDHMWDLPLVKMLDVIGDRLPPDAMLDQQAELLNRGNIEHSDGLRSFQQAYRDELAGALELALPALRRTVESIYKSSNPSRPIACSEDHVSEAHAVLIAVAQTLEGRLALRTAHLAALMHAATRWNKTKRLTANDLPDFMHAQAGIAYCHALFTDGPTKHMLDQKNLRIQADFHCFTAASVKAAHDWIRCERPGG